MIELNKIRDWRSRSGGRDRIFVKRNRVLEVKLPPVAEAVDHDCSVEVRGHEPGLAPAKAPWRPPMAS
ncbi:MAG: hypothetical protein FWD68_16970 [Alphaproteobacteria bacterium]|nr:hypothetical protein [Alphaproteobacteria bacterium]